MGILFTTHMGFLLTIVLGIQFTISKRGQVLIFGIDRLKLEKYYVRNWSLWLDFVILLKTVKVVWRGEGV